MSVQRWTMQHLVGKVGLTLDADSNGEWVTYADHARIVAEMEQAHAAALAEAVSVIEGLADQQAMPDDWYAETLERLRAGAAVAPRTLTASDPGYHSQRCLHCDHIRATHTLTAHGCIGHALPGRPGADCPCAEFIHDGEATP